MPAAEITAGIASIRAAIDLAKAISASRDAKLGARKADELGLLLSEVIGKLLEANKVQMAQLEEITALKAELANASDWKAEKQRYELKQVGNGAFAQMLKPSARGEESPHWLCPTCFESGKKSYFQFSVQAAAVGSVYRCKRCNGHMTTNSGPAWL